jgi:NADH-quinone oxidoreductase subunit N
MTGGFFAKFYVFSAAVKANLIWLTIIGVLNSGVGAYYYLRIIVMMYMRESRKEVPVTPVPFALRSGAGHAASPRLFISVISQPRAAVCAGLSATTGSAFSARNLFRARFGAARTSVAKSQKLVKIVQYWI